MKQVIKDYIADVQRLCDILDADEIDKVCKLLLEEYKSGKKIFVAGNGGSAGTSNHFCCDFGKNAVKGDTQRPKIISLSANTFNPVDKTIKTKSIKAIVFFIFSSKHLYA